MFFTVPIPVYGCIQGIVRHQPPTLSSSRRFSSGSLYALHYQPRELSMRLELPRHLSQSRFHVFNNHSESVHVFNNQLDYVSGCTVDHELD
jgi:hypothetical protein